MNQPAPAQTMVDLAYERIRRRILDNEWPPGHRALEQEVALALGMSRTPVREALIRLQNDGLVEVVHGTAPDIAGQGIANPTAMILSAAMMLEWLADRHDDPALLDGALALESAVRASFSSGSVLPREFGGRSGTADITQAVLERL